MDDQTEIHNRIAPAIVKQIVKEPIEAGGSNTDVLVVLESVIVGVLLAIVKRGGDEKVLDAIVAAVKRRMAKNRLSGIGPAGRAGPAGAVH